MTDVKAFLKPIEAAMKAGVTHLDTQFKKIQLGVATTSFLESVKIEIHEQSFSPLKAHSEINKRDAQTLLVLPRDKSNMKAIEMGLQKANLGVSIQNEGAQLVVKLPPLTSERRKQFCEDLKKQTEAAKQGLRKTRQEAMDVIKKINVEDEKKKLIKGLEDLTAAAIKELDALCAKKTAEIMKI